MGPDVLASNNFGINAEIVRMVDGEIEGLAKKLRDLKSYRNTLTLISRLPPEILSTIFLFLHASPPSHLPRGIGMEWVVVSHVCTQWRQVSLDCTDLWSHINIRRVSSFTEAFLKRSKQAPLTIWAQVTQSSRADIRMILENMGRIRRLSLFPQIQALDESVLNLLETRPAPLLERFNLNWPSRETSPLLATLFRGVHPKLRDLRLSGCNFSWDFPPLMALVDLSIESTRRGNQLPSIAQLTSILQNTPNLENLNIVGPLSSPFAGTSTGTPISLPRLSGICIRSEIHPCIKLLENMSYPVTSTVDISSLGPSGHTLEDALGIVHLSFNSPRFIGAGPPVKYLRIRSPLSFDYGDDMLSIDAWYDSGSLRYEPHDIPRVALGIYIPDDGALLGGINHTTFWDTLPLENLHTLEIIDFDLQTSLWLRLFDRLEKLTILKIKPLRAGGPMEMLELLSTLPTEITGHSPGGPNESPLLYLPALRELTILRWNFGMATEGNEQTPSLLEKLIAFLKMRKELGAGIEAMEIESCRYLYESGAEELKKVVPHIIWDELETTPASEDGGDDSNEY